MNERLQLVTFRNVNNLADLLIFSIAFSAGCFAKYLINTPNFFNNFNSNLVLLLFFIFYGSNLLFLNLFRVYYTPRLRIVRQVLWLYSKSLLCAYIFSIFIAGVLTIVDVNRIIFTLSTGAAFSLLATKEFIFRKFLGYLREGGYNFKNVIIVGNDRDLVEDLKKECDQSLLLGLNLKGVILSEEEKLPTELSGLPVLGTLKDVPKLLEDEVVHIVIFLVEDEANITFSGAIWACEECGVEVWLHLDLLNRMIARSSIGYLNNIPLLCFQAGPSHSDGIFVKNVFDRLSAALLIILLSPIFVCIFFLVKSTSRGPIFYRQLRAGFNGKKFYMYKIRSMYEDADEQKSELLAMNEMDGPAFKMESDPRITPIGKFLRKFSLDELPQLWNVLRGDMSLVGPRPMDVKEVEDVHGWPRRRLSMKPGITCIWQVSGRNDIEFDHWMRMDLEYIDNWSLWLDFKILLKTIPAVFSGHGAS